MAQRLTGPCQNGRCFRLAIAGTKYCAECAPEVAQRDQRSRGTAHQRGYDITWQRFREWFLMQPSNIMCADCKVTPSSEVHHLAKVKDYPERKLDPTNCLGLCRGCHQRRTRRGE